MKRTPKTYEKELGRGLLYREDLAAVTRIFFGWNEDGSVRPEQGIDVGARISVTSEEADYELHCCSDLSLVREERAKTFLLRKIDGDIDDLDAPTTRLRINSGGVVTIESECGGTTEVRVLAERIKEYVRERCPMSLAWLRGTTVRGVVATTVLGLGIATLNALFFLSHGRWVLGAIGAAVSMLTPWVVMTSGSGIRVTKKPESSFWTRNRDDIYVQLATGIIMLVVGLAIGRFVQ